MTLGQSPIRLGAEDRARGRTMFGVDTGRPGDLYLVCVRAENAPAKIESIDTQAAMAVPGVVRIFTAQDIPGVNRLGIIAVTRDQEFLADKIIRHRGQAVALVAAETEASARLAAEKIVVNFTEIPGVFNPFDALSGNAPLVHPETKTDNIQSKRTIIKGDADEALAKSAVVHEAEYSTSYIEHSALEPEGGRAWIEDGRLYITACTQNPHYDQGDVALFLGLEKEQVRVIQAETGGGFGGKLDVSVQPYLGLAAWLLKQPVRMTYTREETFQGTGKRHPFFMKYKTGADSGGKLTAMKVELVADTGAYASYGLAVAMRAAVHATGPYYVPNVHIDCKLAYTNNPWAGAMRGFGVPQVAVGHEGEIDAMADLIGMDRLEFRLLNALKPGQETATGQVLTHSVGIVQCLEKIRPHYDAWKAEMSRSQCVGHGMGLGAMYYGIGNTGVSNPSTAQVEWTPQGRVILYTGAADIGQGSDTVLRQLAAERLKVDLSRIDLVRGDTDRTTNAGATSASRQTYISGNAVVNAAAALEESILKQAEDLMEIGRRDLEMIDGEIRAKGAPSRTISVEEVVKSMVEKGIPTKQDGDFDPVTKTLDPETGQGVPYGTYAFAAQVARVEVDSCTGEVIVRNVAAAHDVGKAVHAQGVKGQICGGVVMGLGMALMEEFVPGKNENFENYHIPTMMDAPEIEPIIVEDPEETGPYGAKGVGEPALIPTAPAIASAVGQALGRPMRHLPISLERVMGAITGDDDAC
jgi:CO/xanthine dehydrogenase Mo-binding subunit